jgi:malate dehydrogenase (oxaloacetate-decarboxylating)
MNWAKSYPAKETNRALRSGSLAEMLVGADAFVGLSTGGIVTADMIRSMAPDPIVMALSIPEPEIDPLTAVDAGAAVVATGRSGYPNQVNNSLAFPGMFRGAHDARASGINDEMKIAVAKAIVGLAGDEQLASRYIIPEALDLRVAPAAVAARAAVETGVARVPVDPAAVAARTRETIYGLI